MIKILRLDAIIQKVISIKSLFLLIIITFIGLWTQKV